MDYSRAGGTDDYHFSPFASQHLILGGYFNVSLHGLTDYHHVGESIPRLRTLLDTNDSLRASSIAHCCGRAGLDGRATHTLQLVGPRGSVDTWTIVFFKEVRNETRASAGLRLFQDRSQGGVCCSYTENENEVYDEERCELAWLEAGRFLGKSGCRDVDRLGKLESIVLCLRVLLLDSGYSTCGVFFSLSTWWLMWGLTEVVSPVKHQCQFGSCMAFSLPSVDSQLVPAPDGHARISLEVHVDH